MSEHLRENNGLLATVEQRVLVWIAGRLPAAINSDHLTGLALFAMALSGAGFAVALGTAVARNVRALAALEPRPPRGLKPPLYAHREG